MTREAWDFHQAKEASRRGKVGQEEAENARKEAVEAAATAEETYRKAVSRRITVLIAEGKAATAARDIARGEPEIAHLAYLRDVSQGMKEISEQRAWRHTADRKDIQELIEWSRVVAPLGQGPEPADLAQPIGGRRAA